MSESPAEVFCPVHPHREATLRCNRCERPMCIDCAVLTPTGYRCKECIRGQLKVFDTSKTADYPLAFLTALLLSFAGTLAIRFLGIWGLLAAPFAGMLISEAVRKLTGRRRSPQLFLTAAVATALGALPLLVLSLLGGSWLMALLAGAYGFIAAPAVWYRLRGISLR